MNLRKRIEKVQEALLIRRAKDCICSNDARYHNSEESAAARRIPCPVHGKRRLECYIDLPITMALLDPPDRHLCHCPAMLERQAEEEGRDLTPEERMVAEAQFQAWWDKQICKLESPKHEVLTPPPRR